MCLVLVKWIRHTYFLKLIFFCSWQGKCLCWETMKLHRCIIRVWFSKFIVFYLPLMTLLGNKNGSKFRVSCNLITWWCVLNYKSYSLVCDCRRGCSRIWCGQKHHADVSTSTYILSDIPRLFINSLILFQLGPIQRGRRSWIASSWTWSEIIPIVWGTYKRSRCLASTPS